MARGDFHTHSTMSDGLLAPAELVRRAAANGVAVLALTDHDTTAGVPEATAAAAPLGLRLIPGVELSADLPEGGDAHILGYFRSVDQPRLQTQLAHLPRGRMARGRTMLDKLAALGLPLDWERLLAIAGEAAVGRPHVALAMSRRATWTACARRSTATCTPAARPTRSARSSTPEEAVASCGRAAAWPPWRTRRSWTTSMPPWTASSPPASEAWRSTTRTTRRRRSIGFRRAGRRARPTPTGGSDHHGLHDDEREPGDIPLPERRWRRSWPCWSGSGTRRRQAHERHGPHGHPARRHGHRRDPGHDPHRYPLLLVDRIVELERGRRAVGIKNVSANEPFFQGHFPGNPISRGSW